MTKRVGAAYTLFAAFVVIFLIMGVIWVALAYAEGLMASTSQTLYPYGVFSPSVVGLINFGIAAIPFIVLISVAIMVIIALQREKRFDQ